MELHQPQDRRRTVLPLGQRCVARSPALFLADGRRVELELQLVERILFGGVNLFLGQLVVCDRVESLDAGRHVTVGNALHFQLVQPAEIRDLLERDRGVVRQPDRSRLGMIGLFICQSPAKSRLAGKSACPVGPAPRIRGLA